jgi:hypothetical protein
VVAVGIRLTGHQVVLAVVAAVLALQQRVVLEHLGKVMRVVETLALPPLFTPLAVVAVLMLLVEVFLELLLVLGVLEQHHQSLAHLLPMLAVVAVHLVQQVVLAVLVAVAREIQVVLVHLELQILVVVVAVVLAQAVALAVLA